MPPPACSNHRRSAQQVEERDTSSARPCPARPGWKITGWLCRIPHPAAPDDIKAAHPADDSEGKTNRQELELSGHRQVGANGNQ